MDTERGLFTVPPTKLQKLMGQARELIARIATNRGLVPARLLAGVAPEGLLGRHGL